MASTQTDVREYRYFVDNQWRTAKDHQLFEVHEPYSGKLFARVAAGSRADARDAVDAASKAFTGWSETAPAENPVVFVRDAGDKKWHAVGFTRRLSVGFFTATERVKPDDFAPADLLHHEKPKDKK